MTPEQFIRSLQLQPPRPAYLFLGPEIHRRRQCREALLDKVLPPEERSSGLTRHDLDTLPLSEVLDDARSMSLFAGNRVIWVGAAESALPRGRAATAEADAGEGDAAGAAKGDAALLAAYCNDPTPGVVLVFDCSRYDFEGEDKARCERVAKFYAAIPASVEFHHTTAVEARAFAQQRAAELGLRIGPPQLDRLVEATAADLARLVNELDKLALYAPPGGEISAQDIAALVPNLSETTIFALVNALARRDRLESLRLLDTLIREGEYLPLALTFLGTLLRLALAAREQQLRSVQDVQTYFQRQGIAMWRTRAEQVYNASLKFPRETLEQAISLVFRADRDLKGNRPDDRIVLEDFVLRLT
ncbi:MAG: DNA polymerase III subunit delta [Bryobacteraceae bacterium]